MANRSVSVLGHVSQPAASFGFDARKMNLDPKYQAQVMKSSTERSFWSKKPAPASKTKTQSSEQSQSGDPGASRPPAAQNASSARMSGSQKPLAQVSSDYAGSKYASRKPDACITANTVLFAAERQISNNPLINSKVGKALARIACGPTTHGAPVKDIYSISLPELCLLQQAFVGADVEKKGILDPERFQTAFMPFVSNPGDISRLFMRIDADCDGNISWEEFLSFCVSQDDSKMSIESEFSRREFEYPTIQENSQVSSFACSCRGREN